ncbi:glycosyltransferase [Marivita sp. S6314]|uniref:glycosyltransferase n=1 Tax=Marivita sp. S6314 TaxID=2926406 RepID=UPI001FF625C8|nr:glycosyltransferase [Marivita sp. S6314]MCK0151963.1 glycosyltransferase [Marivita sp. S6314]
MPYRLLRLYRRYITHHLSLPLARLPGPDQPEVFVRLSGGRVCLDAAGVLEHGGACARGAAPSLPFDLSSGIRVSLRSDPATPHHVPPLPRRHLLAAHVRMWPRMVGRLATLVPLLPRLRDPHVRARARARLGLRAASPAPVLQPRPGPAPLTHPDIGIDLILPVHNAASHVARCLDRIPLMTDLPWRLVIVEDGSTDPEIRQMLSVWSAQRPEVTLITHDAPCGFAGAVNAGLACLGRINRPVVLLNSDITLPQGWASRLIAPLLADDTIASVTPLSNEGELMGAPHACAGVSLRNGEVDDVDAALRPFARDHDLPSLPTGTGFCLVLGPKWLSRVPRFDEGFGRGYGEEVDWCQRIRLLGGRHVCQTGLFVGHVGAASFGRSQRQALRAKSARILSRRWPRFDDAVAQSLSNDPLALDRLRAGLAWAKARLGPQPLPVYLAHSLGGGTARWLTQRLQTHDLAVVLRVGGPLRWEIELHSQAGVTRGSTEAFADVLDLLRLAGARAVTYTCAVGDPWPEEIPFRLLNLCAGGHRLTVQFHDYFPLNRDYTFRSAPDPDWQALWRVALDRAKALEVFSEASHRIVAQVHPDLAHKITLRPHAPLGPVPRLTPALSRRPVIGVPGHLNTQKGAAVIAWLAQALARTGEARLVVLGEVAPDCALPRSVTVLGGYTLEDLPHLVARHEIGLWVIPSLWPETFSYVTHEALATGLPCFGFDLGGQGDALRAQTNGHVVSVRNTGGAAVEAMLAALRAHPDWPSCALDRDTDTAKPPRFVQVRA